MPMLIAGVLLFAGLHFIPSLAPGLKKAGQSRLGENGYKGIFSLLVIAAMVLIVFGWRGAQTTYLYQPPAELRTPAFWLLLLAFLLFVVSNRSSRLCQWLRHPQLTGVLLWTCAHLMLNGDSRSLVLFGGLGLWAIIEMFAISRREGDWVKGQPPGWGTEIVSLLIAVVVLVAVMFAHPWIAGIAII